MPNFRDYMYPEGDPHLHDQPEVVDEGHIHALERNRFLSKRTVAVLGCMVVFSGVAVPYAIDAMRDPTGQLQGCDEDKDVPDQITELNFASVNAYRKFIPGVINNMFDEENLVAMTVQEVTARQESAYREILEDKCVISVVTNKNPLDSGQRTLIISTARPVGIDKYVLSRQGFFGKMFESIKNLGGDGVDSVKSASPTVSKTRNNFPENRVALSATFDYRSGSGPVARVRFAGAHLGDKVYEKEPQQRDFINYVANPEQNVVACGDMNEDAKNIRKKFEKQGLSVPVTGRTSKNYPYRTIDMCAYRWVVGSSDGAVATKTIDVEVSDHKAVVFRLILGDYPQY